MARSPFVVNFRELPLSRLARSQLGGIAESLIAHPHQRSFLVNKLILPNHYDRDRGLYIPLSSSTKLFKHITRDFGAVPSEITPVEGDTLTLFGNPLLLPIGWGEDGFRLGDADAPKLRATNAGFLCVTYEYDCETVEQFEELLSWCRADGDLDKVDAALRQYKDFRGYCVVFTGGRSLHFHFVFNTAHLKKAPFGADWESRLADQGMISAIMHNAYATYWAAIGEIITEILKPSLSTDAVMSSIGQLRRLPWGIRILEKPSPIFDLAAGTAVPQLVIKENILQRAPKGATAWLVPEEFSTAHPLATAKRRGPTGGFCSSGVDVITELQSICRQEWGEYPKPVSAEQQHDEWIIRFKNSDNDKTPSTIVAGDNRKLLLRGRHSFTQDFYLPDQMTVQELMDHLINRFGNPRPILEQQLASAAEPSPRSPPYKRPTGPSQPFIRRMEEGIRTRFSEGYEDVSTEELQIRYREKLREIISMARDWKDYIVLSGEGIGKTTAHFDILGDEALDAAMSSRDDIQRFSCFAFRSSAQAHQKAEEYRCRPNSKSRNVVYIQSFWQIYKDCCRDEDASPIPKGNFPDHSINAVLKQIRREQPRVFACLETVREKIWLRFDAGSTMLFTSHGTAMSWYLSRLTRIWYHPAFRPFDDGQDHDLLRRQFALATVIIDEPEIDEMLHFISKPLYDHLSNHQIELPDWRNLDRRARETHFKLVKDQIPDSDRDIEFETYDELMRLNLAALAEYRVDYDIIPFGHDRTPTGIYRAEHGKTFYIGEKDWPFASQTRWGFLTTERLVTDVIAKIYEKRRKSLLRVDADDLTGIYPIRIPIYCDTRARSQEVTKLATEILESNSQAWVISDGVNSGAGNVLTFQRMKGSNDLAGNDIYIIVTPLAPEQFARLNVIGQWLHIRNIIPEYYQGLINQAVGRNTGFRQQEGTKTVIVTSRRMHKLVPDAVNQFRPRVLLYPIDDKPW